MGNGHLLPSTPKYSKNLIKIYEFSSWFHRALQRKKACYSNRLSLFRILDEIRIEKSEYRHPRCRFTKNGKAIDYPSIFSSSTPLVSCANFSTKKKEITAQTA
jgi:hypothetical protein